MIRRLPVALAALAALSLPAAAQVAPGEETLPPERILELISGSWEADPIETPEAERGAHRCEQSPEVIRIVPTEDGPIFEYQRGNVEDAVVLRSAIRHLSMAIWLQYDLEWRRTPEGDLVDWMLFMPDEDHFFMVRRDWVRDGRFNRTPMRRRCPTGPVS